MKLLNKLIFTLTATLPSYALAAEGNGDWIQPASALAETLQSGLVQVGGPVIGIGIVLIGLWMAASGNPDYKRIAVVIFGGLLITVGPSAITALMGSAA